MRLVVRRERRRLAAQALGISLALALTVSADAAQKRMSPTFEVSPDEDLPVPPIPPAQKPAYAAAPVPDSGLNTLADPGDSSSQGAKISPGFYHPKDYNLGEGYLSGSTVQGEQERRANPLPRLQLKMPLQ